MSSIEPLVPRTEFGLEQGEIYLNQASVGLVSQSVAAVQDAWNARLRRGTIDFDDATEAAALDETRDAIGSLLAVDAEQIAVLGSATEGLVQFAHWLQPGADDNVVVITDDFPSVVGPWKKLARQSGFHLRLAGPIGANADDPTDIVARLVDHATIAICVSHVHFATGHVIELERLGALARRHGALLVVDATQSAGVIPIDLASTLVDFAVGTSHKWLCAPHGAAWAYVGPRLSDMEAPLVGWRGMQDPTDFADQAGKHLRGARGLQLGSISCGAGTALGAGAAYVSKIGLASVAEHSRALGSELIAGLDGLDAQILTPRPPLRRAGIVAARFREWSADALASALAARRIFVSARHGAVRFSMHLFNGGNDIDETVNAIADVLRERQRGRTADRVRPRAHPGIRWP